jgi:competence protein ComEC
MAAALFFLRRRLWFAFALAVAAFALAGAFAIEAQSSTVSGKSFARDEPLTVVAHVIAEGNLEPEGGGAVRQSVDIETESAESTAPSLLTPVRMRLNIYSKDAGAREDSAEDLAQGRSGMARDMPMFRYGQRIRFAAVLISPRNSRNPGAFDYVSYLQEQGITATASVKFRDVDLLDGFSGSMLGFWRTRVHRSIVDRIRRLWPEPTAGLIAAMAIGERSFVERSDRVDFQRSGTYHALVVAGLHIGILAGFLLWLLRSLGMGDIIAGGCAMVLIFAYAAVTGESAQL